MAALAISGCGKSNPLIGKWTGSNSGVPVHWEFTTDKVITDAFPIPQDFEMNAHGTPVSYDLSGLSHGVGQVVLNAGNKLNGGPNILTLDLLDSDSVVYEVSRIGSYTLGQSPVVLVTLHRDPN